MSKLFLAAVLVAATFLPLVPPVTAYGSCAGQSQHIGDPEAAIDPGHPGQLQPDCCRGPTVPVADYYLSFRVPVQYKIYHEPHPNGNLTTQPVGAIEWGATHPTDPRGEAVSLGSTDVAVAETAGVWIYEEMNGQTGLQRGGTQAGIEDGCVDVLAPGVLYHDMLVL